MKTKQTLNTLDLFSGCGGLSLGLSLSTHSSGLSFETKMAVDNWKISCSTFERNLGVTPVCVALDPENLSEIFDGLGKIDVVVGGPPCQGFSTSGKRALDDPRNNLVWSFLKSVEVTKPSAFVMENVSGFSTFANGRLLSEVKEFARKLGFVPRAALLQASMNGVPQRRKRFFLVGTLEPGFLFPGETAEGLEVEFDGLDFEQQISPSFEVSFEEAVSDLPPIGAGQSAGEYHGPAKNAFQEKMRKGAKALTLHAAVGHGAKMLELMKYIPEGKSAFDEDVYETIPEHIRPNGGFKNSYARITGSKPSPTITRNFTTPSSANCIHPNQDRALSIREGARLQSFPDKFEFLGTIEEVRLQIGNAVPPLLAKALGEALLSHLAQSVEPSKA